VWSGGRVETCRKIAKAKVMRTRVKMNEASDDIGTRIYVCVGVCVGGEVTNVMMIMKM